jgi:hypothetical protein
MSIKTLGPIKSGVAAGGAGVATNNFTTLERVTGKIKAVVLKYLDSPPGTTDVTVATAGTLMPALTILTITNAAANAHFPIRHKISDEAGADVTYDGTNEVYDDVVIDDYVKVTIAQADNGDSVDVFLIMEDCE